MFKKLLYCSIFERYVQLLNMKNNKTKVKEDNFEVLRNLYKSPDSSQRDLAEKLGFSLGKLNYCLKALKDKGLVKIRNFKKKSDKIGNIQYVLTPQGISLRTKLTINFMKRKMKEYDELKKELKK